MPNFEVSQLVWGYLDRKVYRVLHRSYNEMSGWWYVCENVDTYRYDTKPFHFHEYDLEGIAFEKSITRRKLYVV